MIVLIIMISIPIFNLDTYVIEYNFFQSSIDTLHYLANQENFKSTDSLFMENWNYLTSNTKLFGAELVNLRLVENINSSDGTTILKEFGSNSSLDNHRQYEFDGKLRFWVNPSFISNIFENHRNWVKVVHCWICRHQIRKWYQCHFIDASNNFRLYLFGRISFVFCERYEHIYLNSHWKHA